MGIVGGVLWVNVCVCVCVATRAFMATLSRPPPSSSSSQWPHQASPPPSHLPINLRTLHHSQYHHPHLTQPTQLVPSSPPTPPYHKSKDLWLKAGSKVVTLSGRNGARRKEVWMKEAAVEKSAIPRHTAHAVGAGNSAWSRRKSVIMSVLNDQDLVSALSREQNHLELPDYNYIVRWLGDQKKWQEACQAIDWMEKNKKLSAQTFTTFISLMSRAGHPERALRVFQNLGDHEIKLNGVVCSALLKAVISTGKIEKAFSLFEQLENEGFAPDSFIYSVLIAGCANHRGGYAKAESLFREMSIRGLKPDSYIYASFLNVCAKFGLEEKAKEIFEMMKQDNITPNIIHYSTLLNMYAEKMKPNEAERVFNDILEAGLTLNKIVFHSLLKAYANCGILKKARKLFDDMKSFGFLPNECEYAHVAYLMMMDCCIKAGDMDEAHKYFDELKSKSIEPGTHVYCLLISSYSKMRNVDMVEMLATELENTQRGNIGLVAWNTLLKSYCECGVTDGVMSTLKKMDDENVAPDRATFNILICYFCKGGLFDLALQTLQDLQANKLRPNLNSYAPIILGLARTGKLDEAVDVYNMMVQARVTVSVGVYEALIDALCQHKRTNEAFKYLVEMKRINLYPGASCLRSLLIAAGADIHLIKEVFDENINSDCVLNEVNLDAILLSYEEHGYYDALPELLRCMKEHDCVASKKVLNDLIKRLRDGNHLIVMRLVEQYCDIVNVMPNYIK